MPFRNYILLFALVASLPAARAQEDKYLDKTPPSVYGPATTRYITPMRLKDNLGTYQSLVQEQPQLIGDIHRFTFAQRLGNRIQNLGNNGTAAKPIFFRMPRYIGITAGFHAYDLYFRRPEQFRYYDTKSPYTHIYAMLARFGSFFTEVCHTRNVTPYWNIGAHYRQMMTDKEWIPNYSPGDRNAVANGLDLFTHVKTPAGGYELLAHALIMKHRVRETGGIMAYRGRSVFEYKQEQELLEFSKLWKKNISVYNRLERGEGDKYPENSDYRRRFQLYHQLALREALWLYHE
ncbi:MAG: putative porin, partial [Bacteroidota bacterium]